jgi:hypothetical protein
VASTCSPPPALASDCWGSRGGGSGSVVFSSGAGVAETGFGLNLMAVTDLMKQNQLYYYISRKEQDMHYAKRIYTYSEDFFMTAFFSLRARGFSTTVLIAGGGVTPAGCEVPAIAMVTSPAEVVDGSVPAVSAVPPARTLSPANSVRVTFWRLGSGGEAEGQQNRQCQHATTLLFDNYTGQQLHTWGGSTACALRLRTTRRPRGTNGKDSANSTDDLGELFFFAFPSAALSARGLSLSVISSLGGASAA